MAKNNCSFNTVRWFILLLCVACIHYGGANAKSLNKQQEALRQAQCPSVAGGSVSTPLDMTRKYLRKIYQSQIGVKELTGHNDGKEVEAYLKICGLKKGNPWCAAYVSWCYLKAGVKVKPTAYAPNWFVPKYHLTNKPEQGDLFGIFFRSMNRIAHVGFYDNDAGAFIITNEGNSNDNGSREGDRVVSKRRLKRQIKYYSNWITSTSSVTMIKK